MMTFASGIEEMTEPVYVEIADYYDNRKAVVTVTADDWIDNTWQQFEDMSKILTEKRIYYTGAIITDLANWTQIQYWLNQGYAEAASHSRTHPKTVPYNTYDSEINGSRQDIIGNLTLPSHFSFNGTEYVYTWIEPYSKSDSTIRQKLGEYKYLTDRKVHIDDEWATWNSTNGLFDRIGFSMRMESGYETNVETLNSKFDSVYNAGGIYHLMTHPANVNWETGQYADLHTSHISNREDVWYVNFGLLYLYRWIDTQNVIQVTSTGSLQDKVFKISMSSTDRQNYGAKYPVTYVFEIPQSWANVYVNYCFRETNLWTTMENKTSSDFFNGVNAVRFDFSDHKAYVSIGFDDVSNEIYLQILPQDDQPTADFTTSPTSGPAPLNVSFTDNSTSYDGIVSWIWDFGDGETSTEQHPTHVYNDGEYTVSLTVEDTNGDNDIETKIDYITVTASNQPPVADANGSYTGTEGAPITFDGSGSHDPDGDIVSYTWDFDDGTTEIFIGSNLTAFATHTYNQNGTYTVTLTVTDDDSATDTDTTTATVADTNPTADFSATPTSGPEPLTVSFTDLSTSYDGITAWEWDFDNDSVVDSTEQHPIHVYGQDGVHTVTLEIYEGDGDSYRETKVDYVTVADTRPIADFSATPTSGPEPLQVNFTDLSTSNDGITSWTWNFGDGETSTKQNPTHKFPDDGTFNVSLTVTDADGSTDTITKQVSVQNVGPTADFNIISSERPTVNEDITFKDQSSDPDGFIVSWFWDLGDGTNSSTQKVTHRYYALGTFIVNLTVADDDGQNATISKSITIYDVVPPVTIDDYDGLWHTSDFTINLTATDDLSGVQAIHYIINDGPVMDIQTHGQPRISVEGYNQLEYWGVDFYGNEETHHVIPDIKLDKTSRAPAMWRVVGIVLVIGTFAAGAIFWRARKNKTPTLRKEKEEN